MFVYTIHKYDKASLEYFKHVRPQSSERKCCKLQRLLTDRYISFVLSRSCLYVSSSSDEVAILQMHTRGVDEAKQCFENSAV